jgi:hypothetical protein
MKPGSTTQIRLFAAATAAEVTAARARTRYRLVSGQAAGRPGAGGCQVWRRGRTGLVSQPAIRAIDATSLALLMSISCCSRADFGRSAW